MQLEKMELKLNYHFILLVVLSHFPIFRQVHVTITSGMKFAHFSRHFSETNRLNCTKFGRHISAINHHGIIKLQVAQLSQRDCATAAWVKFGQK